MTQDRFRFRAWNAITREMFEPFRIDWLNGGMAVDDYDPSRFVGDNLILMQCTGLKDKNGRLSYEGDVLDDPSGRILEMCWWTAAARFQCYAKMPPSEQQAISPLAYPWEIYLDVKCACTAIQNAIIGNIYENPELVK